MPSPLAELEAWQADLPGMFGDGVTSVGPFRPASRQEILEARQTYGADEIQIDDDAQVSVGQDGSGHWVQAWVWMLADPPEPADA